MSDYLLSVDEMEQVSDYLEKGFKVHNVYENLSGMFVEFERKEVVCLPILTADARKYFAAKLQEQVAEV
ncbi:hypothetical protein [Solibacillus sp. FSL K6-1523]|uniref:hypothetical protein n=1 Tax=Solibacillus sp. FSL K6-1523 TaxID=2921471 RepID=UPI0030F9F306